MKLFKINKKQFYNNQIKLICNKMINHQNFVKIQKKQKKHMNKYDLITKFNNMNIVNQ